jgi:hypothetical protein
MDILKMLADLRAERQQVQEAIVAIERLATGTHGKRRGRPPKWMSSAVDNNARPATTPRTKRTVSAAGRKRMAEAQKRRWAAKKVQAISAASKA